MQEPVFDDWLLTVVEKFKQLTEAQKNKTVDLIVSASGSQQLRHLQENLHSLLYKDFLILLPPELQEYILCFLDGSSLLRCCAVSKKWRDIVVHCQEPWKRSCNTLGVVMPCKTSLTSQIRLDYRHRYVKVGKLLLTMKRMGSFSDVIFDANVGKVTALYYREGVLAAGGENKIVYMWDTTSNKDILNIRTECSIAAIRFDQNNLIVASYNGSVRSWLLPKAIPSHRYGQHSMAVFSVDFNPNLDLLVSGAADNLVRVWSLRTGKLHATLRGHTHWVIKVMISDINHSGEDNSCRNILLTMDKDSILIWPLKLNNANGNNYRTLTNSHRIGLTNCQEFNFFTPGLYCDGEYVYFMKQDPREEGFTKFCKFSLLQGQMISEKEMNTKVKALLGVGDKYMCVSTPWKGRIPNMYVNDVQTLKPVAAHYLPPSKNTTPDCSQLTIGDRDWLNGLTGYNNRGLILAAGLEDTSVYLLKWSNMD